MSELRTLTTETDAPASDTTPKRSAVGALLQIGAFVGVILGIIAFWQLTPAGAWVQTTIEVVLGALGYWAIPVFILVYAVLIGMWVPGTVLTLAGAAVFGPIVAVPVNYAGAVLGAGVGFLVARKFGRAPMDRAFRDRFAWYDRYQGLIRRRGFETMLYLRVIPTPYTAISYLGGLSPISLGRFLGATALGILPGSIAISFFLGTVFERLKEGDFSAMLSWDLFAGAALWGAAIFIPTLMRFAQRRWGWFAWMDEAEEAVES